jgi:hypothetical protein
MKPLVRQTDPFGSESYPFGTPEAGTNVLKLTTIVLLHWFTRRQNREEEDKRAEDGRKTQQINRWKQSLWLYHWVEPLALLLFSQMASQ